MLSDLVFQKAFGYMRFLFPTLDMMVHVETGEVYIIVTLKKLTEKNQTAVELLRKLVAAQGLFLV